MKYQQLVISIGLVLTAVVPTRAAHVSPAWFVEGRQEYDHLFHSGDPARIQQRVALLQWGKANRRAFTCCVSGLHIPDARRGGALLLMFLAQQFWEDVFQSIGR